MTVGSANLELADASPSAGHRAALFVDQPGLDAREERRADPAGPSGGFGPGAHGDERLGHPVALDRPLTGQRGQALEHGTGRPALPDTSSRAERSAAAASGSAATRDHTVGTPKYRLPPSAAAAA